MEVDQQKFLPFPKTDALKHLNNILMIIDFKSFIKCYEEKILKSYKPFEYTCPKCGAIARFHRHGTYLRWVTYISVEGYIVFEPFEVLRLKCQSCNATHSIIPSDIIPFQIYSLPVLLYLCKLILINGDSIRNTVNKTKTTIQTIYQKLKLLKHYLPLIELYFRQVSLYTSAVSITPKIAITLLLLPTMNFYCYYNCHGHPVFLNRLNTISYTYYLGAAFY